jgi:hypothetical protein
MEPAGGSADPRIMSGIFVFVTIKKIVITFASDNEMDKRLENMVVG